jgi:hypothetical protein
MDVKIKNFDVKMEVKTKGVEFQVRSPNGREHLGDVVVNRTEIVWCKGKTQVANGKKIRWKKLIAMIESQ